MTLPTDDSQLEQEMPDLDARLTPPPLTSRRSYSPGYDWPVIADGVLVNPGRLALLERVAATAAVLRSYSQAQRDYFRAALKDLDAAVDALERHDKGEAQHGVR